MKINKKNHKKNNIILYIYNAGEKQHENQAIRKQINKKKITCKSKNK